MRRFLRYALLFFLVFAAAVFLAYHLRVLLADQRHRAERPMPTPAPVPAGGNGAPAGQIVVIQGGAGPAVTAAVAALRDQLPPECRLEDYTVDAATLAGARDLLAARNTAAMLPAAEDIAGPAAEQALLA